MISFKSIQPLESSQALDWLGKFSEEELSRHGWSKSKLEACFKTYEYIYSGEQGAVSSVIFYHLPANDTLEVLFLATCPGDRRRSQMRSLFTELLQRHHGQIWLECREDNLPAIDLYRRLGLRETGRRLGYYQDGTTAILFNF